MKKFCTDWEDWNNDTRCNAWVATAVIGAGVLGAGASIYGANKAANAQEQAAQQGIDFQSKVFQQTQANLAPYRDLGTAASQQLTANNDYTAPITMDEATLEQTPGYQFNLTQGLKATQNSAAARGLGVSGAALKGAANFATGLADNTYQNQFNNANINNTNAYNRLKGLVDTGENAAAGTGAQGNQAASTIGGLSVGQGNAAAGAATATGGAISNAANNLGGYYAYKGLYGSGSDVGSMPATGAGAPGAATSNMYAISQGINPF